jgi:hypothetical protein
MASKRAIAASAWPSSCTRAAERAGFARADGGTGSKRSGRAVSASRNDRGIVERTVGSRHACAVKTVVRAGGLRAAQPPGSGGNRSALRAYSATLFPGVRNSRRRCPVTM